ncbi:MAG: zinc ribbon domain-containing protein [Dehalococcoidales bacterium]
MGAKREPEKEHYFCPYCEEEIVEISFPYCQACGVTVFYCPVCRKPLPRDKKVCPHCGAEIKGEKA